MTTRQTLRIGAAAIALTLGADPALARTTDGPVTIDPVAANPVPDPVPAATTDDQVDIVVTGTRQGEIKAIDTKRQANNIVEALYANDVGKLPDQNVAEAIRRLPGVSVANDQGEGRYVVIRGVNPNLVNVVLNGLTLPAPEPDGRQVKLDDIPSALINAVIVTKSLTPTQDANAIGGEVNIQTLSAFDRKEKYFADARIQYGSYHLNGGHPYEGDIQAGGRFGANEQFGAVISVNYSQRPIESENFQGATTYRAVTTRAGSSLASVMLPDQAGLRDYNLVRTREGVVLNLDWRPTDTTKLFLRGTLSRFDDNETRDQFIIDNEGVPTATSATTGTFTARGSVRVRRRNEADNTKSVQAGGSTDIAGGTLNVAGAWTRAQKRDPLRSEYNFRTGGSALTVDYDVSDTPYFFTPRVQPNANQTAYTLNSVNYDRRNAVETLYQGKVDYSHPIGLGDGSTIQVGAKYLARHKTNERDYTVFGLASGRTFTLANVSYLGDTGFYDGAYTFPVRIDYDRAQAFLAANPGTLTQSASNLQTIRANSLANDYDVTERIAAGYAMATLKFASFTLIPGVRVEHTSNRNQAKTITATSTSTQGFNAFDKRDYTDVFPDLNARFDVTDRLVLRAAATTAIGRPNYPDLSPFVLVDQTTNPTTVTLGNPDIKPYKAVNLDLGVEYYLPNDQGLLSAGVFYKHLDDPIYTQSAINVSGNFAGQALTGVSTVQPINLDRAIIKGVEANAQLRFTFLPSPLDGFGVALNYAHIEGDGRGTLLGATPRTGKVPLFLQSDDVGTAQAFYEKYGVALRVAYSYRSPYLDVLGTDAATDQYTDANGQLDVSLSYQVTPQLTFFGQALNLTDAPWRRYIGTKDQLVERERYDYSFRWGAQLHF